MSGPEDRAVEKSCSDGARFSEHIAVVKRCDERVIGFSESEREGRTSAADQEPDGTISWRLSGSSPQGEEDTLTACRILVKAMNAAGSSWSEPVVGSEPADCEASDLHDPANRIQIQVVRAIPTPDIWRELNTTHTLSRPATQPRDLVQPVRDAIQSKLGIPASLRARLVLALDAKRIPAMGLHDVGTLLRTELAEWLEQIRFREVWVVGPTVDLTFRLYPTASTAV